MKKSYFLALLLFCVMSTFNTFSQDYKWRDKPLDSLKQRIVTESRYSGFYFDDKVDFRKTNFLQ